MKVIITCEPGNIEAAFALAREQLARVDRYDRVGWGWVFPMGNAQAFVRGIKGGISITERAA